MSRRLLASAGLALAVAAGVPATARAQATAVRFVIDSVGDSTFTFRIERFRWVAAAQRGIAVNPLQRDALVARFRVLAVREGVATALITGETTRVTTEHAALIVPPRVPWNRQRTFWSGLGIGTAVGAAVGLLLGNL